MGAMRCVVRITLYVYAQASQPYMGAEPKYCTIIAEESATIGVVTSLP